jgi:hypothetical protein
VTDPSQRPEQTWLEGWTSHTGVECADQLKCPVCNARQRASAQPGPLPAIGRHAAGPARLRPPGLTTYDLPGVCPEPRTPWLALTLAALAGAVIGSTGACIWWLW